MIFGAIAAIGQTNLKRLIAYSSIGHIGYTLAGLATGSNQGIQSSIIYITIYILMNGTYKNLINTHVAAIFGIKAKNIVTDVGEPW